MTLTGFSQTIFTTQITTNGIFDAVYDDLGNKYSLNNLRLDSPLKRLSIIFFKSFIKNNKFWPSVFLISNYWFLFEK